MNKIPILNEIESSLSGRWCNRLPNTLHYNKVLSETLYKLDEQDDINSFEYFQLSLLEAITNIAINDVKPKAELLDFKPLYNFRIPKYHTLFKTNNTGIDFNSFGTEENHCRMVKPFCNDGLECVFDKEFKCKKTKAS